MEIQVLAWDNHPNIPPLFEKNVKVRQLDLSVGIPGPMVASLQCSRTLNYHLLKKGESNRLMFKVQGGCELYQPPNILNSKTVNALPPKGETILFIKILSLREQCTSGTNWKIQLLVPLQQMHIELASCATNNMHSLLLILCQN